MITPSLPVRVAVPHSSPVSSTGFADDSAGVDLLAVYDPDDFSFPVWDGIIIQSVSGGVVDPVLHTASLLASMVLLADCVTASSCVAADEGGGTAAASGIAPASSGAAATTVAAAAAHVGGAGPV